MSSQVSQSIFAGKGADLVNCMVPEQSTWLLCTVSVIPVNCHCKN